MVHCVKCGTENKDDAKFCIKCGAQLYVTRESEQYRRVENECFGLPHGGIIVAVIIGIIIILWGFTSYLNILYPTQDYSRWIGPIIAVTIGILIILGAIYRMQRRRY
jgi:uncharacterized membrane protein YvbJ